MLPAIVATLEELSRHCSTIDASHVNGWAVDTWELSSDAVTSLARLYRDLLRAPMLEAQVGSTLAADGINLDALLLGEEESNEVVTRADMTELAAAASLIAKEGAPIDRMHLPNVPKGSRRQSAPGIDVVVANVRVAGDPTTLEEGEYLIVCSVKHSLSDPGEVPRRVGQSLSKSQLTLPYLVQQLRVVHGRLHEQGVDVARIYLSLVNFPEAPYVRFVGAGAVDTLHRRELSEGLKHLPAVNGGRRHFRQLLVPDLGTVHKQVAS